MSTNGVFLKTALLNQTIKITPHDTFYFRNKRILLDSPIISKRKRSLERAVDGVGVFSEHGVEERVTSYQ